MDVILCATGNGTQSRTVQSTAVETALQRQARLVFVHVVDLQQLGELDESLVPAARAELAWLGEAILRLAQDRARRQGVQTTSAILYGDVREALEGYMRAHPVTLLMMGAATSEEITGFARHVQDELGVAVEFVAA